MNDEKPLSQRIAEACATAMYERDNNARSLGINIADIREAYAKLTMKVRTDFLNGHDICQGGMVFSLADTAFAYACNSRNQVTVASACTIDFITPGRLNDLLIAEARECALKGRTGVYDVIVHNQHSELVALFRGKSHRLAGEVISDLPK